MPPTVEPEDVAYLLETVNHYFPAAKLTPRDVVSAFAGLRPLVAPPPAAASRRPTCRARRRSSSSRSGLITIAGGKLTTYRLIAAEVVDRVADAPRARRSTAAAIGRSRTADLPLPGGSTPPETLAAAAAARTGTGWRATSSTISPVATAGASTAVLGVVAKDRALGAPVIPAQPDPRAEVVAAVEGELAMTLEDVLRRRTQLALFDPAGGTAAADEVAGAHGAAARLEPGRRPRRRRGPTSRRCARISAGGAERRAREPQGARDAGPERSPGRWPRRTPTPGASSTTGRRGSCSSPPSCPPSAPTRW